MKPRPRPRFKHVVLIGKTHGVATDPVQSRQALSGIAHFL